MFFEIFAEDFDFFLIERDADAQVVFPVFGGRLRDDVVPAFFIEEDADGRQTPSVGVSGFGEELAGGRGIEAQALR